MPPLTGRDEAGGKRSWRLKFDLGLDPAAGRPDHALRDGPGH